MPNSGHSELAFGESMDIGCECGHDVAQLQIVTDHRDVFYPASWLTTAKLICVGGHETQVELPNPFPHWTFA